MKPAKLSVSIVIPAYNEEHYLRACLDSIATQTVQPLEVVVVDNNSTDGTVRVARSYPFVRVVAAERQGIVHARNVGFDAAHGDIIGRTDADARLAPDWVAQAQRLFEQQPTLDAATGSLGFYDVPLRKLIERIDLNIRRYLTWCLARGRQQFLAGGNMIIRRTTWQAIRTTVCHDEAIHEDVDLAAHMARGYRLCFDPSLRIEVSLRRVDSSFKSFYDYARATPQTYARHRLGGRYWMYPPMWMIFAVYPALRFLYRRHNAKPRHAASYTRRASLFDFD